MAGVGIVFCAYDGSALNGDAAGAATFQAVGHSYLHVMSRGFFLRRGNPVSAHRGHLAAAIDVLPHLGLAHDGDTAGAAHQCRVAVGH